ncbi:MAG TPA: ferredoxin [Armatimonadota bacterium]|nr:ferredoxin [Armatimonadota bacterium]HOM72377.1 ferredoxin [Armatimonadota bacterium]HPP75695.1 ferredoxin [Armatimonadota bacterium]
MKAIVNDGCIGDGICADTCPEVFEIGDDGLAHVIVDEVPPEAEERAREAADACPVVVIEIIE